MSSPGTTGGHTPHVRVVVLNHDGGDRLERCVAALLATEWPAGSLDVVVIDNASGDGSAAAVAERHPTVQVVHHGRNTGFPANNLALHDLRGVDHVALVNNDAYVEPGWLAPLVDALESDASLGAASSLLLFAKEAVPTVNNAGNEVLTSGYGRDRGFGSTDLAAYAEPADVFAWCGAAVLLRPAYLADVGLFDERFFLYYEDTDLSWRGQLRGWRYRYVPGSRVHHDHAASTGSGSPLQLFYTERNRLLMLVKCAPAPMALRAVVRFPASTLSYAVRGNRARAAVHARAFLSFLALAPHALAARVRIRRRRTVDDDVILRRLTAG